MHKAKTLFIIGTCLFTISSIEHLPSANADKRMCPQNDVLTASQRKNLIDDYSEQISDAEAKIQKCCRSECGFSLNNEKIDYGFILLKTAAVVGGVSAEKLSPIAKGVIALGTEGGLELLKLYVKKKYGSDKCTKEVKREISKRMRDIKNSLSKGKVSDIDLIEICRSSVDKTSTEKIEFIKDTLGGPSEEPDTGTIDPIVPLPVAHQPQPSPIVPLPVTTQPKPRLPIIISDIAPSSVRNTGWDQYCKGGGQDYCEFLIYAGKTAYSENYKIITGDREIEEAYLRISAVLDDAPRDSSVVNYELVVTINGHRLPEQLKLTSIRHGTPLGGPFNNFEVDTLRLPKIAYQYFKSGNNEINYRLAAPVGAWIVFKQSVLFITVR